MITCIVVYLQHSLHVHSVIHRLIRQTWYGTLFVLGISKMLSVCSSLSCALFRQVYLAARRWLSSPVDIPCRNPSRYSWGLKFVPWRICNSSARVGIFLTHDKASHTRSWNLINFVIKNKQEKINLISSYRSFSSFFPFSSPSILYKN